MSSVIIAWAINYCRMDKLLSEIVFYSYFLFMLPKFLSVGFNFDEYNHILYEASRNILGSFFIILSSFHILACKKNRLQFPLLIPFISFVSCVLLYGRSSILLSFFLLFYGLVIRYKIKFPIVVAVVIIFFGGYFSVEIYDFIMQKTNFAIGLKTERTVMLGEYFSSMSTYSFFFGQDFQQCCQYIVSFESNPHNSFVMGHARYGISHTLIFIFFSFYVFKQKDLELALIFLLISARYFVDQIGLFSPLDFVYLYMVVVLISCKRKVKDTFK
ncbi:hypothetical protein [Pectobacterium versatile]|uniref:hypothetical protein n=1 Tax=Pectobacterium versatile TaxID=2488639 RepID=UPI0038699029